jgi:hypothetical protein
MNDKLEPEDYDLLEAKLNFHTDPHWEMMVIEETLRAMIRHNIKQTWFRYRELSQCLTLNLREHHDD